MVHGSAFARRDDRDMTGGPRKRGGRSQVRRRPSARGAEDPFVDRPALYARGFGGGGFGRGGGGGRIFGPGDLRLVLLALVAQKPRHGYELIKALEEKLGGGYSPSPGSVYPTLTLLEELGHVRATQSESAKRLFEITPAGREFLKEHRATLDGIMNRVGLAARAWSSHAPPVAVFQAMHTLKAALLFHRGDWSEAETARVRDIIEQAARAISERSDRE